MNKGKVISMLYITALAVAFMWFCKFKEWSTLQHAVAGTFIGVCYKMINEQQHILEVEQKKVIEPHVKNIVEKCSKNCKKFIDTCAKPWSHKELTDIDSIFKAVFDDEHNIREMHREMENIMKCCTLACQFYEEFRSPNGSEHQKFIIFCTNFTPILAWLHESGTSRRVKHQRDGIKKKHCDILNLIITTELVLAYKMAKNYETQLMKKLANADPNLRGSTYYMTALAILTNMMLNIYDNYLTHEGVREEVMFGFDFSWKYVSKDPIEQSLQNFGLEWIENQ